MGKRILAIEDDTDILSILEIIFQDEGFEVVCNSKGMSIHEIALVHPDLVLLDVRIFGFDKTGAQMCRDIKSNVKTCHLPVILLSAEQNLENIAMECGADFHMSKPFDIDGLIKVVNDYTHDKPVV